MQRVRIGLTGLAFVFLLVLLGSVFKSAGEHSNPSVNMTGHAASSGSGIASNQAEATEPLAELGVAPGNADTNTATGSPSPDHR